MPTCSITLTDAAKVSAELRALGKTGDALADELREHFGIGLGLEGQAALASKPIEQVVAASDFGRDAIGKATITYSEPGGVGWQIFDAKVQQVGTDNFTQFERIVLRTMFNAPEEMHQRFEQALQDLRTGHFIRDEPRGDGDPTRGGHRGPG